MMFSFCLIDISNFNGLFIIQIDLEEYGEALELAQRFELDTDLVYQRQWTKSPTTVISIKDYLVSISNAAFCRKVISLCPAVGNLAAYCCFL